MAKKWYRYSVINPTTGYQYDAANYALFYPPNSSGTYIAQNCNEGWYVCMVLAEEAPDCPPCTGALGSYDTWKPYSPLSDNIQAYLLTATSTGTSQPDWPSGAKKYVYMRSTPWPY